MIIKRYEGEFKRYLLDLYNKLGQKTPIKYIKMTADYGDSDIAFQYGMMLYEGKGVEQDKIEAIKYLKIAADRSTNKEAKKRFIDIVMQENKQTNYKQDIANYSTYLYKNDPENKVEYLKIMASDKDVKSTLSYANMLYKGDGIPENKEEAAKYYKIVAENLCRQNKIEDAIKFYKISANCGEIDSIKIMIEYFESKKAYDEKEEKYKETDRDTENLEQIKKYYKLLIKNVEKNYKNKDEVIQWAEYLVYIDDNDYESIVIYIDILLHYNCELSSYEEYCEKLAKKYYEEKKFSDAIKYYKILNNEDILFDILTSKDVKEKLSPNEIIKEILELVNKINDREKIHQLYFESISLGSLDMLIILTELINKYSIDEIKNMLATLDKYLSYIKENKIKNLNGITLKFLEEIAKNLESNIEPNTQKSKYLIESLCEVGNKLKKYDSTENAKKIYEYVFKTQNFKTAYKIIADNYIEILINAGDIENAIIIYRRTADKFSNSPNIDDKIKSLLYYEKARNLFLITKNRKIERLRLEIKDIYFEVTLKYIYMLLCGDISFYNKYTCPIIKEFEMKNESLVKEVGKEKANEYAKQAKENCQILIKTESFYREWLKNKQKTRDEWIEYVKGYKVIENNEDKIKTAKFIYAIMLYKGIGIERNEKRALKMFGKFISTGIPLFWEEIIIEYYKNKKIEYNFFHNKEDLENKILHVITYKTLPNSTEEINPKEYFLSNLPKLSTCEANLSTIIYFYKIISSEFGYNKKFTKDFISFLNYHYDKIDYNYYDEEEEECAENKKYYKHDEVEQLIKTVEDFSKKLAQYDKKIQISSQSQP